MNDGDDESAALRQGSGLCWRTSLLNEILRMKMDTISLSFFSSKTSITKTPSDGLGYTFTDLLFNLLIPTEPESPIVILLQ